MKFNNYKGKNNIKWGFLGKQKEYQVAVPPKKETPIKLSAYSSKDDDFVRIDLKPKFVVGGQNPIYNITPSITPTNTTTPVTATPTPTITPTPSITATITPSSITATPTPTLTNTPTLSSTTTLTPTPTLSVSPTLTITPTTTNTPTLSMTPTPTQSSTDCPWILRTSRNATWNKITYGDNKFIAVGNSSAIMSSNDGGENWTSQILGVGTSLSNITYGNGLFVAISNTLNNAQKIYSSPDGITWTPRGETTVVAFRALNFTNGQFVVVGNATTTQISTDGINWTSHAHPTTSVSSVAYGNGLYALIRESGDAQRVFVSSDAITWSGITLDSTIANRTWNAITYGNGIFVAVSSSGEYKIMASYDGLSWTGSTQQNVPLYYDVTFGGGKFVAVARDGAPNQVITSTDGLNWTTQVAPADSDWNGVTYGGGRYVAVGRTNSPNQVMTNCDYTPD